MPRGLGDMHVKPLVAMAQKHVDALNSRMLMMCIILQWYVDNSTVA